METVPNDTELRELLASLYGIEVKETVRLKSVIGVTAQSGERYIWKPALGDPQLTTLRLEMVHRVSRLLWTRGFTAAFPIQNRRREWLSETGPGTYGYLQPWLAGRHINLGSLQERLSAMATVGYLHRLSLGWPLHDWATFCGPQLVTKVSAKRQACLRVWPMVTGRCSELAADQTALLAELEAGYQAVVWLSELTSSGPSTASDPVLVFCHRDLAPHNLLWTDDGLDVSLIDFDLAGVDHPFTDVVQLANHTLSLTEPKPGLFRDLVSVHRRTAGWPAQVEPIIWQLFRFPDLLIRALVEWVNAGCPGTGKAKVIAAIDKERVRRQVWARDRHDR